MVRDAREVPVEDGARTRRDTPRVETGETQLTSGGHGAARRRYERCLARPVERRGAADADKAHAREARAQR